MIKLQRFHNLLIALLCAPIAAIAADGNAVIVNGGANPAAIACVACHGEDLKGNAEAGIPRTAGLSADYIVKQLHDFRAGTRHNAMMQAVALTLSEDEIAAVAKAISAKPGVNILVTAPTNPSADSAAWIAMRGAWERNIPPCTSCHGPDGMGVGNTFPPLAGQPAMYLEAQLHAFKGTPAGNVAKRGSKAKMLATRYNDPNGLMRHIAASLSDAEIKMLAEYFAAMDVSDTPVAADRIFLK
ncbi:MAG: c-type cytochrome [Proteobacteria bacterium]|nr:c-type cytochrome [Pseudomonadota bacterium]